MGGVAGTIAELMLLPAVLSVVAGWLVTAEALARVVPEENRHVRYPWASRTNFWVYLLGGFRDVAAAAEDDEARAWQRAALGRLMFVCGLLAFMAALAMWQTRVGV